ncbi:MAG TPA: hypothetical protein VMW41_00580 [Candidatus Bathyarchaeia archaeon]|nr:hypothetical protein [Candidatus Bathyarchaeia archaeon]
MLNSIFKVSLKSSLITFFIILTPFFIPLYSLLVVIFVVVKLIRIANHQLIEEPRRIAEVLCPTEEINPAKRPQRTPDKLTFYKDCLIESFVKEKAYRILTPQSADLGISFKNLNEAKREISLVR